MNKSLAYLIAVFTLSSCSASSYDSSISTLGCHGFVADGPTATYAYLQGDPNFGGKWIDYSDAGDEIFYRSLELYESAGSLLLSLEQNSPSGDWFRVDDYCFDSDKKLVRLGSDLKTFNGGVRVLRVWSPENFTVDSPDSIEIIDLETKGVVEFNDISFLDNPPYLSNDYDSLMKHLNFDY